MRSLSWFNGSADGAVQEFGIVAAVLGSALALTVWGLRAAWAHIMRRYGGGASNSDREW